MKFQQFMQKSLLMDLYYKFHQNFTPLTQNLRDHGFNLHDSLILLALFFESPKKVNPSQLEEVLLIPKDQVSHSLNRLEKKALLERTLDTHDKRKRLLTLTALGKKQASSLIKVFDQKEDELESSTSTIG